VDNNDMGVIAGLDNTNFLVGLPINSDIYQAYTPVDKSKILF